MKPFLQYINHSWMKLTGHSILLASLVAIVALFVFIICNKFSSLTIFYDHKNPIYLINSLFIAFVFVSFLPILINLCIYLFDSIALLFHYRGNNISIMNWHIASIVAMVLVLIIIIFFIAQVYYTIFRQTKILRLESIVQFNGWFPILIFSIFLLIDWTIWHNARTICREQEDDSNYYIDKNFAQESIAFIDIPMLFILVLTAFFMYKLENIEYFKSFLSDPKTFLKPVVIPLQDSQKAIIELFPNGIETGITMTSIIYSQIMYFILSVKWDYIRWKESAK